MTGQSYVNGDAYIKSAYSGYHSHEGCNVGIILAMVIFNHRVYFLAGEYVTAKELMSEVLVCSRGFVPKLAGKSSGDLEGLPSSPVGPVRTLLENSGNSFDSRKEDGFQGSRGVFHWNNVCYDIMINGKLRRILDNVYGWEKLGTLTAPST